MTALVGVRALAGSRADPLPFLGALLSPRLGVVIELFDLVCFVEHSVRAFMC